MHYTHYQKPEKSYGQGHKASLSYRMTLKDDDLSSYQMWTS